MDKLSHLICDVVEEGEWKPIVMSKHGPKVSHLIFANDLFLFGVASKAQARCMMRCLEMFTQAVGGKVNNSKSSIFFSLRVSPWNKKR